GLGPLLQFFAAAQNLGMSGRFCYLGHDFSPPKQGWGLGRWSVSALAGPLHWDAEAAIAACTPMACKTRIMPVGINVHSNWHYFPDRFNRRRERWMQRRLVQGCENYANRPASIRPSWRNSPRWNSRAYPDGKAALGKPGYPTSSRWP